MRLGTKVYLLHMYVYLGCALEFLHNRAKNKFKFLYKCTCRFYIHAITSYIDIPAKCFFPQLASTPNSNLVACMYFKTMAPQTYYFLKRIV